MSYELDLSCIKEKNIYPLNENFRGYSKNGDEISFTNYYMQKNGKPFFCISGELHFSRMSEDRWEDELIKMKMCGINVVSTYVFWIHHEEEEGVFRFDGSRDLRRFAELCKKHGMYVILRVGPFCHGEVRNGGFPDWLYGKPFEARSLNDGFLSCVKRLYSALSAQIDGMFFKDDGPIIGVQIDNEYMHSSAPWEITAGVSNEWVFGGNEGNEYMLKLKALASECGLDPVFYTCTGWGGAATPDEMLPLWGGYAFRPWLFYSYRGEHPATEEYVYQDYHNDGAVCTSDFRPAYKPETRPYSCCEMGGGMMCSYYYRFQLPYKSVDAMANIKIASGCNFLGYYMFHGGSNPVGKHGTFMNEGQVPRISYDYQAALGEYGQVRESYRRLKSIHYFTQHFGDRLCGLQTVLPVGASHISPTDGKALRYAVRTDGKRGFLFINNYQDHFELPDRRDEEITLKLEQGNLTWKLSIAGDENAILPFCFDMDGIELVKASAQLIAKTEYSGDKTYVFFVPEGMRGEFVFEDSAKISGAGGNAYKCAEDLHAERFTVNKGGHSVNILALSRELSNNMYILRDGRLAFTDAALLEDDNGIRIESTESRNTIGIYPSDDPHELFGSCLVETPERNANASVSQVGPSRYAIHLTQDVLDGVKDARLQINYIGDIGKAFIGGHLIHDNFANGATWEIGLRDFADELKNDFITLYIVPLKEGVNVNVKSAMAARSEEVKNLTSDLISVQVQPVYEIKIS